MLISSPHASAHSFAHAQILGYPAALGHTGHDLIINRQLSLRVANGHDERESCGLRVGGSLAVLRRNNDPPVIAGSPPRKVLPVNFYWGPFETVLHQMLFIKLGNVARLARDLLLVLSLWCAGIISSQRHLHIPSAILCPVSQIEGRIVC